MARNHPVFHRLRGFVRLTDNPYRDHPALGGYSRDDPEGLRERGRGDVVVNVERARAILRSHGVDVPSEPDLARSAMVG